MKYQLILEAIFFTLLLPGTVTVWVPSVILKEAGSVGLPPFTFLAGITFITGLAGMVILLYCIWEFAFYGKGTLAPVDPPKVLVVHGFYKYTRNPMYLSVLCVLISEALFFSNGSILIYAVFVFLFFYLFVVLYEEPHLKKEFAEEYENYISKVPRWGITLKPFKDDNTDR